MTEIISISFIISEEKTVKSMLIFSLSNSKTSLFISEAGRSTVQINVLFCKSETENVFCLQKNGALRTFIASPANFRQSSSLPSFPDALELL